MDELEKTFRWVAKERGCRCSICGKGQWLRTDKDPLPDYLVLYHTQHGVVHTFDECSSFGSNGLTIRCDYCSRYPNITPASFGRVKRPVKKNHNQYGKVWVTDGNTSRFIEPDRLCGYLNMGWRKGRTIHTRPPNQAGKIRITNGVSNLYVDADAEIPEGWWRGKVNFGARYGYDGFGSQYTNYTNHHPRGRGARTGALPHGKSSHLLSYTEAGPGD